MGQVIDFILYNLKKKIKQNSNYSMNDMERKAEIERLEEEIRILDHIEKDSIDEAIAELKESLSDYMSEEEINELIENDIKEMIKDE